MSLLDSFLSFFTNSTSDSAIRSIDELSPGGQSIEWHNNYGTSADYQTPAESSSSFTSSDWSSNSF